MTDLVCGWPSCGAGLPLVAWDDHEAWWCPDHLRPTRLGIMGICRQCHLGSVSWLWWNEQWEPVHDRCVHRWVLETAPHRRPLGAYARRAT